MKSRYLRTLSPTCAPFLGSPPHLSPKGRKGWAVGQSFLTQGGPCADEGAEGGSRESWAWSEPQTAMGWGSDLVAAGVGLNRPLDQEGLGSPSSSSTPVGAGRVEVAAARPQKSGRDQAGSQLTSLGVVELLCLTALSQLQPPPCPRAEPRESQSHRNHSPSSTTGSSRSLDPRP